LTSLFEMRKRLSTIEPIENKILMFDERLKAAEAEMKALLKKYEKESLDVQKIQKESLSSFILKTFGKYEDTLEKEKQEEMKAKTDYDKSAANLDEIKNEIAELKERLSSLRALEPEYRSELEKRKKEIQHNISASGRQKYIRHENEMEELVRQRVEIEEALNAANQVLLTAQTAAGSLEKADSWATWDIWFGGGIITHSIKYSHIDKAEDCFNRLSAQIEILCAELKDVHEFAAQDFTNISSTRRAIDFWFDNIFTDFSVRSQVRENEERICLLIEQVTEIRNGLNEKLHGLSCRETEIKRQQEDLLISL